MNSKALKTLEYYKIIEILKGFTASEPGKELVEELEPVNSLSQVRDRLNETSDGVSCILRRGSPPIGGIREMRPSLKRVEIGGVLNPGELLGISDTLRVCRNLKGYMDAELKAENRNIVGDLIGCLFMNKRVEDKIKLAIVNEEEISDLASSTLGNIRRQIRTLQDSIRDRLNDIVKSSRYQKYMQENIVTMRGDRYVIPVKQEHRSDVPGLIHDSSSSGATIFVEPMAVVEANNNIKHLKIKEQAEIDRILAELTGDVAEILDGLKANVSTLAKLDFIFAKARLSLEYDCTCPVMNTENRIRIKKGRHPLLDKKTVVPIDFWIGSDFKTLVLTGPNTGGKTVTLKTVGLFTLMAQSGLHVPAQDNTEIAIFDEVFADIGDEQSIEQSLSTFSSHMKNIVAILEKSSDSSLVLFDELGAGTDPTEGSALAMSILDYLRDLGAITISTTHYSELKAYAVSTSGVENACCEFDVETLKPTYRLLIGVPGKSNAFAISSKLGLSGTIIEKAKEFLSGDEIHFEDMLEKIENNRRQAEKDKLQAEINRIEIEKIKKELEDQRRKLDTQRDKIMREAREEAKKLLLEAKSDAEDIIQEMRRLEEEKEQQNKDRTIHELRVKLNKKLDGVSESLLDTIKRPANVKPPQNLKPGESVLIVNLNQKGIVLEAPGNDNEALIQAGIMKIKVNVANLKKIDEQQAVIKSHGAGKIGVSKAKSITTELDLRGLSLGDALENVDKYLDDASLSGLKEVTIIHGKGTGVLRSGIHDYLKHNSHVKTYRLGRYGEGESGVTVVELK